MYCCRCQGEERIRVRLVPPSPSLRERLRQWIEQLDSDGTLQGVRGRIGWGDRRFMREAGVYPLHLDAAFFWYVTPAGEVLVEDNDRFGHPLDPEDSVCAALNAVAQAARVRPELRELLPERPEGAPDCPRCGGTGDEDRWGMCSCAGLGWVDSYSKIL